MAPLLYGATLVLGFATALVLLGVAFVKSTDIGYSSGAKRAALRLVGAAVVTLLATLGVYYASQDAWADIAEAECIAYNDQAGRSATFVRATHWTWRCVVDTPQGGVVEPPIRIELGND